MAKKINKDLEEEPPKMEKIAKKSKLTEKDVEELSDLIDKEVWEDLKKECA